ncbi:MAG: hypothetical protein ACI9O4_001712 [Chitinophagales bacterium]|jgi:hypothetical protein
MLKLIVILSFCTPQDTIQRDSTKSILFMRQMNQANIDKIKYRHQQGFFCDFEDQINKGRKMNLNIGVGEQ